MPLLSWGANVAKTLDNVVDETRLMLKDRRVPYRYTDADVIEAINSAFGEAKRVRPDIFLVPGANIALPDFSPGQIGTAVVFPIDEMFFMAIVHYAVGKLQLGDDQFAVDNRAMTLLARFEQQLRG